MTQVINNFILFLGGDSTMHNKMTNLNPTSHPGINSTAKS